MVRQNDAMGVRAAAEHGSARSRLRANSSA